MRAERGVSESRWGVCVMVRTGTQDFWSDELFLPCTEEQVLSLLPEAVPAPHIAAFCYPHP